MISQQIENWKIEWTFNSYDIKVFVFARFYSFHHMPYRSTIIR